MEHRDRAAWSESGNILSTLVLAAAGILFGAVIGALGAPRLLPKVPLDSRWRDLPLVGVILPVDLTSVRPAYGMVVDSEAKEMLERLKAEKKKWEEKSALLEGREKACQEQAQTVATAEKAVLALQQQMDKKFKEMTIEITESEKKNLRQLAKIYGQMRPEDAAPIVKGLEDDMVVKVLSLMKERQAGMILAAYAKTDEKSARRAGEISDKMRKVVATEDSRKKEARKNG